MPEQDAIGTPDTQFWIVDVRGLGGDAIDLNDFQIARKPKIFKTGNPDIQASEEETGEAPRNALDRFLQGWCDRVTAVQENSTAAVGSDFDQLYAFSRRRYIMHPCLVLAQIETCHANRPIITEDQLFDAVLRISRHDRHSLISDRENVATFSRAGEAEEKESFYELVRTNERTLFAMAFSILGNPVDAEETVQEAILKAFRARNTFRGDCKFSTWLVQITINESKLRLRKERRHLFQSLEDRSEDEAGYYRPLDIADWRPIPSKELETLQRGQRLGKNPGHVEFFRQRIGCRVW